MRARRILAWAATMGTVIGAAGVIGAGAAAAQTPPPVGEITGTVWFDRDLDGVRQSEEPQRTGALVRLLDAQGTEVDRAFTDPLGNYYFHDRQLGDYTVELDNTDYRSSTGTSRPVTVEPDATSVADFGVFGGRLLGVAWYDTNADGIRQTSEPWRDGATVRVIGPVGEYLVQTDSYGFWDAHDLPRGSYEVYFELPADGEAFTAPNVGDENPDSIAESNTDSDVIEPAFGLAHTDVVFSRDGFYPNSWTNAGYLPVPGQS